MRYPALVAVAVLAAACAGGPRNVAPEMFAVVPGADGHVGTIVVHPEGGHERVIHEAYGVERIRNDGSVEDGRLTEAEVKESFGTTLAAPPGRPATFTLYFLEGKDELTPESKLEMDRVLAELKRRPLPDIMVIGHSDSVGGLSYNDKLSLARAIGLPPGQEFSLVEKEPYQPLVPMPVDEALQRAYTHRSDFLAAQQQVKAAELFRHAATAEHLPTLGIEGNYGDSSVTPGNPETVYQLAATLKIPIFTGNKSHADALQAEATLRQDKQQMENLRGQIDYEVRTALLDLQAAADQVEVAQNSVDLANQTLTQARDRFAAGVADNLEVVQAQESLASANENYIAGLYAHNVAKVELARAIGYAEEGVKQYLMNHGP